jgi:hypothetical protein
MSQSSYHSRAIFLALFPAALVAIAVAEGVDTLAVLFALGERAFVPGKHRHVRQSDETRNMLSYTTELILTSERTNLQKRKNPNLAPFLNVTTP